MSDLQKENDELKLELIARFGEMQTLLEENDELNTLLKERETQLEELQAQVSLLSANVERLRDALSFISAGHTPDQPEYLHPYYVADEALNETSAQSLERSEKEGEASSRHIESRIADKQCKQLLAAVEEETIERHVDQIRKKIDSVSYDVVKDALEYIAELFEVQPRKYKEQSDETNP